MSWHDHCTGYTPKHKRNRYAFIDEFGQWNRVKYGSNFNDIHWIISDIPLSEDQLKVVLNKMGIRCGIDKLGDQCTGEKLGKHFYWMKITW